MDADWTESLGHCCSACSATVAIIDADSGHCPLCWAFTNHTDPDRALGQAIAVEGLLLLDTAPHRVPDCARRLRELSEHVAGPALTAVLSDAARDLEEMAAQ